MPDNRQVKSNAVSNQPTDGIEEAIRRLEVNDDQEPGGLVQSSPYPDRPGEPDCLHYLRTGICGYGSNCRFNHPSNATQGDQVKEELPERFGQPDCGYFLKTGTCKYGSTCKYHHPRDRNGAGPVLFNILGHPMRQDEKSCPYYMRTGSCKFGAACKFHHPQPASLGTSYPVAGPAAFVSTGPSAISSAGPPYMGGPPTWSLPRAPYMSGPRSQGPQTYIPVVFSPSQSIVPGQGWNAYVGNLSPPSSTNVLASNLVYNSRNQGDLSSSRQLQMVSTPGQNFPDRPDQPECRYFMSTGTCKYGSDCKYNHPKERIAQPLFDNGLPSRPGRAVCPTYSSYGLCKYGSTCRFDHPFLGYPYGLSLPPLPILDPSFTTYPIMQAAHLSETSPSSKVPGWVRSPNPASNKHENSVTKVSDDPPEEGSSPPHLSQASSEPSHG
ncbi:zinc finger CCCH domain-containing protein 3-like [Tripterygium wilfordii]|uniref:zinc finger CCCH domain-containing protein 3-like n=1 Tax=Tripterygium wilfordii TaxID=458696 RepID=UPI0018F7EEA2|nr:zinc finger CCCH domain-containing protein 3-like [Tripterygium wilfordii]